ncbi:MAG: tail fiber domain-containing protein [Verrucomicrobiota bacterium]
MTLHSSRFLRTGITALLAACCGFAAPARVRAEVPKLLNHQGRIAVGSVNFDGAGQFKFALVSTDGTATYWSNDGSSTAGAEPAAAVSLTVTRGLYSVLLGDAALTGMTAVPAGVFQNADVRLRIWFNDGVNGFELITPDQRLAAAPWALAAETAAAAFSFTTAPAKPVIAWGQAASGKTAVPALTHVAAVAAGTSHSLALLDAGTVTAWGLNTSGQTDVPAGLAGVTEIAAGTFHNLARLNNGTLAAWGGNSNGQTSIPADITTAVKVAAGSTHSLALLADGTVRAWGYNGFGQTAIPAGLAGVTAIASGYDHNLALRSDGTVTAWGREDAGQLLVPPGLNTVTAIAAGAYHSLALKADGTVVAWGWDIAGQSTVPPNLTGVIGIAGGYTFSMALKSDGSIVAWGDSSAAQTTIPPSATAVTRIAAGAFHALALRADLVPAQLARLDESNIFSGSLGIKRAAAANALEVEGDASKSTAGGWLANSDRRIKTEIQPITGALEKLSRVRLVDFRYTDEYRAAHPGIGDRRWPNVVAQEFAEVFPDDVKSSGEKMPDGSPVLQVDTYPLTIYSAAAVQELHRAQEELKQKNAELRSRLEAQEARLRKLEALLPGNP